uniref:Histone H2A n=1 Tax=Callorhinchus milii TaxID=7868 RepID=A0A4W3KI64_CALMI
MIKEVRLSYTLFSQNWSAGCLVRAVGLGRGGTLRGSGLWCWSNCSEILELVGNTPRENNKCHISPRHILLAVRNRPELDQILGPVRINAGKFRDIYILNCQQKAGPL